MVAACSFFCSYHRQSFLLSHKILGVALSINLGLHISDTQSIIGVAFISERNTIPLLNRLHTMLNHGWTIKVSIFLKAMWSVTFQLHSISKVIVLVPLWIRLCLVSELIVLSLDEGKVKLNGILLAAVGFIEYGNPTPRFNQRQNIFVGVWP